MTSYKLKALSGAVTLKGGGVRLLTRGDDLPSGLADGEVDRLKAAGALASAKEWEDGESVPHHLRMPHRATTVDPRDLREPETEELVPETASAAVVVPEGEVLTNTRETSGIPEDKDDDPTLPADGPAGDDKGGKKEKAPK